MKNITDLLEDKYNNPELKSTAGSRLRLMVESEVSLERSSRGLGSHIQSLVEAEDDSKFELKGIKAGAINQSELASKISTYFNILHPAKERNLQKAVDVLNAPYTDSGKQFAQLYILQYLKGIVGRFNASQGGYLFEKFIQGMLGGNQGNKDEDFQFSDAKYKGINYSIKLYDGSKKLAGGKKYKGTFDLGRTAELSYGKDGVVEREVVKFILGLKEGDGNIKLLTLDFVDMLNHIANKQTVRFKNERKNSANHIKDMVGKKINDTDMKLKNKNFKQQDFDDLVKTTQEEGKGSIKTTFKTAELNAFTKIIEEELVEEIDKSFQLITKLKDSFAEYTVSEDSKKLDKLSETQKLNADLEKQFNEVKTVSSGIMKSD